MEMRWVRFDPTLDRVHDMSRSDMLDEGLVWSAAFVPLVVNGHALTAVEIAQNDYDLRQILGRAASDHIRYAYEGWFAEWDERVARIVSSHELSGQPFARFYHSILGIDEAGNVHIRQVEGVLPDLANDLAREGIVDAGILDSGGSCALTMSGWQAT